MKKRYFWPIGQTDPKLEYVGFYHSDRDVEMEGASAIGEALLGREEAVPLFVKPSDVASDGQGRVYVSDIVQRQVWVLDLNRHTARTLEELGAEPLSGIPAGLAISKKGDLYIADGIEAKVLVYDRGGRLLRTFGQGQLKRPVGLVVDDAEGRVYVADPGSHQVVIFEQSGKFLRTLGGPGAEVGRFNRPLDVAIGPGGNLYVLDALNARVQVFSPAGEYLRSFGERGTSLGSFRLPKGIAVSPSGHVYVTDALSHRFIIFDLEGNYLLTVGGRFVFSAKEVLPGGFNLPAGIDADAKDGIWVVDSMNGIVHRFQFLNEEYLRQNPVKPEDLSVPPDL